MFFFFFWDKFKFRGRSTLILFYSSLHNVFPCYLTCLNKHSCLLPLLLYVGIEYTRSTPAWRPGSKSYHTEGPGRASTIHTISKYSQTGYIPSQSTLRPHPESNPVSRYPPPFKISPEQRRVAHLRSAYINQSKSIRSPNNLIACMKKNSHSPFWECPWWYCFTFTRRHLKSETRDPGWKIQMGRVRDAKGRKCPRRPVALAKNIFRPAAVRNCALSNIQMYRSKALPNETFFLGKPKLIFAGFETPPQRYNASILY